VQLRLLNIILLVMGNFCNPSGFFQKNKNKKKRLSSGLF